MLDMRIALTQGRVVTAHAGEGLAFDRISAVP
jgi:hypothetical protein